METIIVEWGIVQNEAHVGGWLPVYYINGKRYGNTYSGHAYDKDVAMSVARGMACEEADKYVGDWNVRVSERK